MVVTHYGFRNYFRKDSDHVKTEAFAIGGSLVLPLRITLLATAVLQIGLGLAYGLMPEAVLGWMGHSGFAPDLAYPLGMLAGRFVVYGGLLLVAARDPVRHRDVILGMVAIQLVDLGFGLWFTARGIVAPALSAIPMIDAAVIAAALYLWRPRAPQAA
jgi:hypothetical protein